MEGLVTKDKKDMEQKLKRLEHENDSLVEELEKHSDGDSIKSSKEKKKSGIKTYSFTFYGILSFSISLLISISFTFYNGTPDFLSNIWSLL